MRKPRQVTIFESLSILAEVGEDIAYPAEVELMSWGLTSVGFICATTTSRS